MIAPLCSLRKGALFFFPFKGEDLLFRIIDKIETEVMAKKVDGSENLYLSPGTMVLTKNEEQILKYATFDSLPTYTPFSWRAYPYVKITDKEAVRLTPIVGKRKGLFHLSENWGGDTKRFPTEEEILDLTFLPSLSESIYQKNDSSDINLDSESPATLYIVEHFTEKTVVRLEEIFTK